MLSTNEAGELLPFVNANATQKTKASVTRLNSVCNIRQYEEQRCRKPWKTGDSSDHVNDIYLMN
jgi:hypothetical protein